METVLVSSGVILALLDADSPLHRQALLSFDPAAGEGGVCSGTAK